jgi:glycerophosphoryl diester phosphodiesterase
MSISSYLIIIFSIISSWFTGNDTLVIAHRGASGYLPEHSIAAKTLAYAQNADYIEQDVVLSKDGVPVILHDVTLDDVTDVAEVFTERVRADGHYYAADFTLDELKQLQLLERFDPENGQRIYPQRFPTAKLGLQIVTLEEEIQLIQGLNKVFQKDIGLYVEIKAPHWHQQNQLDISRAVLKVLADYGYHKRSDKVYLQCFDFEETKRIRQQLNSDLKLVQLIGENSWQESPTDYDYLQTVAGVTEMAKFVDGVGPYIPQLLDESSNRSDFYYALKDADLPLHAYTLRKDQLPEGVSFEQATILLVHLLKLEGVFTDFPDLLRQQLD